MLTKENLPDSAVATCMRLFGSEIKMAIIDVLIDEDMTLEKLKSRLTGYRPMEIEQALQQLYEDDLVRKIILRGKVTYGMSMTGDTLEPIINEMRLWGRGYQQMMRAAI